MTCVNQSQRDRKQNNRYFAEIGLEAIELSLLSSKFDFRLFVHVINHELSFTGKEKVADLELE